MRARVLLVDDEPKIRSVLGAYLEADRFEVIEAGTGPEALQIASEVEQQIALVLLDIGIPRLDGMEVLRELRTVSEVPVILVTARSEEVDRLVGLAVGADDYMVKPVSPREVVARVKAVLRRTGRPPRGEARCDDSGDTTRTSPAPATGLDGEAEWLAFDGLTIDRAGREVRCDGEDVYLSALEFDVLWLLARSPGRVLTRAKLLELAWGYEHLGDERVVDVHIRNIRKRLGDDALHPRFVATVRGVGYKFLPALKSVP